MRIGEESLIKFQELYKTEFGIEITRDEAYEKGMKLLGLVSLIYKPITEKEKNEINNNRIKNITNILTN